MIELLSYRLYGVILAKRLFTKLVIDINRIPFVTKILYHRKNGWCISG
ncbi:hypothetical protein [Thermoactinomyces mirandus]|nr:hypothetical protein [Thermoactinomyces mirandus]